MLNKNKILLIIMMGLFLNNCSVTDAAITVEPDPSQDSTTSITRFTSEAEFDTYLARKLAEMTAEISTTGSPDGYFDSTAVAAEDSAVSSNSEITNNQESGVDEGGIVKNYGEYLLTLRHGELASIRTEENGALELISNISVIPNGLDDSAWYDEILVRDNLVIVIGYRWHNFSSYWQGVTELNFFRIDQNGILTREAEHFFNSSDYYSSSNYTGRVVNGKLVFYMPFYSYRYSSGSYVENLPSIYDMNDDGNLIAKRPLLDKTRIYKPLSTTPYPVLHSIVSCDLDDVRELNCSTRSVIASYEHEYYVSATNIYLWISGNENTLFRMPLEEDSLTAVKVNLSPYSQFSFSESNSGINLFGQVDPDARICEGTSTNALLNVSHAEFSNEPAKVSATSYTCLPASSHWSITERFNDSYLVYGDSTITVVNRGSGSYQTLDLPFFLNRLELADNDFVVTGYWDNTDYSETNLGLALLSIHNDTAFLGETSWLENAYESESRSHAYSYKKQKNGDRIFTLPVVTDLDTRYWKESAALNFFRVEDGTITSLSPVLPQTFTNSGDECSVSCVDWYGNTRGIFLDDAIYALLGDQLTSTSSESGDIESLRHLNINSGEVLTE